MRALVIVALLCGVVAADPQRHITTSTSIEILQPIQFVGPTPEIAPASWRMLDAIAATLNGNPSILLVAIRAFGTDATRDRLVLGVRRSRAVVDELVHRGVASRRLRASGAAQPDPGDPGPGPEILILRRAY